MCGFFAMIGLIGTAVGFAAPPVCHWWAKWAEYWENKE